MAVDNFGNDGMIAVARGEAMRLFIFNPRQVLICELSGTISSVAGFRFSSSPGGRLVQSRPTASLRTSYPAK